MSKKARERAEQAYPSMNGSSWFGASYAKQEIYINAYEQAERDLKLTWEDIEKLDSLLYDAHREFSTDEKKGSKTVMKEMYEEVLRRFNEEKQ